MAELDELRQYISAMTGKEVDSAILLSLLSYIKTFNDRKGPNIIPQRGDYNSSMITNENLEIPESLQELAWGGGLDFNP